MTNFESGKLNTKINIRNQCSKKMLHMPGSTFDFARRRFSPSH